MCKICDQLVYGEYFSLLENHIDLANRSNLVLSKVTIYKNSVDSKVILTLYTSMMDYDQEQAVVIKYCPFCGKAL